MPVQVNISSFLCSYAAYMPPTKFTPVYPIYTPLGRSARSWDAGNV